MSGMLKFGSLFSGIGGIDRAFQLAGFEIAWQCEIDGAARGVLALQFPGIPCCEDVRLLDGSELSAIDVLGFGFPCTDLSVAGKREGLAGKQSGLWYDAHRVIRRLQPRWLVIENVPNLLSSGPKIPGSKRTRRGIDFAIVLAGLTGSIPRVPSGGWANAGFARGPFYNVAWRVLDAQYAGVPQRRRRLFIVGSLGDGRCAEVLFEREGRSWNPPPRRETGARVAPTVTGGSNEPSWHRTHTGRDRMIVEAATFDPRNVTSSANRTRVEYGLPANTLHSEGLSVVTRDVAAIAQSNRGHAGDVFETVRAVSHGAWPMVAHSLSSEGADATSEDGTGQGTPLVLARAQSTSQHRLDGDSDNFIVAHSVRPSASQRLADGSDNLIAATLNSGGNTGGFRTEPGEHLVLARSVALRGRQEGSAAELGDDVANALRSSDGGSSKEHVLAFDYAMQGSERTFIHRKNEQAQMTAARPDAVAGGFGVRRLTPVECERLQGLPDGWTARRVDRAQADSPRYKQIGNGVAVPVVEWIARRLMEVAA